MATKEWCFALLSAAGGRLLPAVAGGARRCHASGLGGGSPTGDAPPSPGLRLPRSGLAAASQATLSPPVALHLATLHCLAHAPQSQAKREPLFASCFWRPCKALARTALCSPGARHLLREGAAGGRGGAKGSRFGTTSITRSPALPGASEGKEARRVARDRS